MLIKHSGQKVLFAPHLLSRSMGDAPPSITLTDPVAASASDNKVQDLAMLLSIASSLFLLFRK